MRGNFPRARRSYCWAVFRLGLSQRLAGNSSPPSRAEQESDAGGNSEARVRPLLQGFVDDIHHGVANLANRMHGVLPFGRRIRDHALDIRPRTGPGSTALRGHDVGDLIG